MRGFVWFAGLVVLLSTAIGIARPDPYMTPFLLVLVPAVAAIVAALANGGRPAVRALLSRIVRRRMRPLYYAIAIGIPVLFTVAIDLAGVLTGQATAGHVLSSVPVSALVVPLVVALPAFFEEFGWRGYGLSVLVDHGVSPLAAAAAVGVVFIVPHLVLHLPGQMYSGLPAWPTPLTLMGYSVFLAWLYLRGGGSSFLSAIGHASLNGLVPLTRGLDPVWVWQARGVVSVALGLAFAGLLISHGPIETADDQPGGEHELPQDDRDNQELADLEAARRVADADR